MKKILAIILCAVIFCAMPLVASAEDEVIPSTDEIATEGEISGAETIPEKTITEVIADYLYEHSIDLGVIGSLIVAMFYEIRKHKSLNGSIGTLNNNAITIAENSSTAIKNAMSEAKDVAEALNTYKVEITQFLEEIRKSAEEKKNLEDTLSHVEQFLKTSKSAVLELSNEVADLLLLANIPNSKKEELYSRHTNAVKELEAAEEVMSNDGNKA